MMAAQGADSLHRCWWGTEPEIYRDYHDHEWGRPVGDDHRLFEKLCLEGFQSGLSWLTILRKRDRFREVFAGFDFARVASFGPSDVERLLQDPGIIRHRGKIEATIRNARCAVALAEEAGSLAAHFWRFEPGPGERPERFDRETLAALGPSPAAVSLSRDLKRRGWSFVGPTTCYAFMQAMGLVNDHVEGCHARDPVEQARSQFPRPTPK